jgi:hypothetical protein
MILCHSQVISLQPVHGCKLPLKLPQNGVDHGTWPIDIIQLILKFVQSDKHNVACTPFQVLDLSTSTVYPILSFGILR